MGSARDPSRTEAYEQSWYALLARHANGESGGADPIAGAGKSGADPGPEVVDAEPAPQLATVTQLVVAVVEPETQASGPDDPPLEPRSDPPSRAAQPPAIRIGVRRLEDPGAVYLRYLTTSPHRDFFRSKYWPASNSVTPVLLWRANHLGADWDLEQVERFMDVAAASADVLIAAAPRSAAPGSAERRAWIDAFLSAEWVREFGIARVSKTVFASLPDLVPDLDPRLTSWARTRWLGVAETEEADEAERCLETWELLEDVLVLRSQQLGRVSRGLRRLAPALAPIGSLGLIQAAFWDDLRTQTDPARVPRLPAGRGRPRASAAPIRSTPAAEATPAEPAKPAKPRTRAASRKATSTTATAPRRPSAKAKAAPAERAGRPVSSS